MAFNCSKQEGEEDGSLSNQLGGNKFFKIVLEPQVKIPKSFLKKWGKNLPDQVTLKAPNGSVRKVGLGHYNGETWLQKGWEEFRDYYSIEYGHMLIFEYDGHSHFNVLIFDKTTMEIEYPIDNVNDHEGCWMPKKEYASDSDDSATHLTDFRTELKGKGIIIRDPDTTFADPDISKFEKSRNIRGKLFKRKWRGKTIVDKETCIAYQKAKSFKSLNPFYVSLMQSSYVGSPFCIKFPLTFAKEHLLRTRNELKFHVDGEKVWTVWCTLSRNIANLTSGWKKFVKDNALKVGDACVFEVNKSNKSQWYITIFRN